MNDGINTSLEQFALLEVYLLDGDMFTRHPVLFCSLDPACLPCIHSYGLSLCKLEEAPVFC